jgi:hypothetical protein
LIFQQKKTADKIITCLSTDDIGLCAQLRQPAQASQEEAHVDVKDGQSRILPKRSTFIHEQPSINFDQTNVGNGVNSKN